MDLRLVLLLSCFFLSGFAALLYQTAWSRELSFVFGTSDLAVAAVLAAYMAGLALGAAAAARLAPRVRRPVLAYGVLEAAIAACALAIPWGIRGLNALYVAAFGGRSLEAGLPPAVNLLQLAGAFVVLLPPTAFMGATLPLLARHAVHRVEEIGSRVGGLYAVNTAGAIAGTLCAAFWLMPSLGLRQTVWVGAGINLLVFALAAWLARRAPLAGASDDAEPGLPVDTTGYTWILPAIGISGAVSFTYEVLWTRLLGHLLGASLHAFATMLASFLLGIALGSAVAARLATTRARAAAGFALAQLGIALTSYVAFAASDSLPALSARLGAGPGSPLPSAALAGIALLPVTLCIGATFPFAVRALTARAEEAATTTARVYAWNTVGAIFGAIGAAFVLLPGIGFEGTLGAGAATSLALAALAALAAPSRRPLLAVVAAVAGLALLLAPPRTPWELLSSSPLRRSRPPGEILYSAVGRTTTVIVTESQGRYGLTTDGLPEATVDAKGMLPLINVAHWLSALPAWIRPDARRLLVIGLGGGVALEILPRSYETIDVIELEPEVLAANRRIASLRERDPLSDPRVRVRIGDARGTLQLVDDRFDAIVSQPSHPWTAGASHLYTREFFSLVRSRLAPGGVFVQWIGLRFVDEELLRSLLSAMQEAFPHVELYRPQLHGLLFAASDAPLDALDGVARTLRESPEDIGRFGIHALEDFASAWTLDEAGVRALLDESVSNTDDDNRLAARSAQLGDDSLSLQAARELFDPLDPLVGADELRLVPLIRSLTWHGASERATDLARRQEGAVEEIGLGWVELGAFRSGRAARHFQRALELDPGNRDALEGLISAQRTVLVAGEEVPGLEPGSLDADLAALIEAWRRAGEKDWPGVAELDEVLERIAPGEALFDLAARARVEWRLAIPDADRAAQALVIAETLLRRNWAPFDALLHAEAAIAAGRIEPAMGSLNNVANRILMAPLASTPQARTLAERALEVARALPEEQQSEVRIWFRADARPGAQREG